MLSKKLTVIVVALVLSVSAFAEDLEGPEAFSLVFGPRIGGSWITTTPDDFTSRVNSLYTGGSYFPVITLFGFNIQQRILLGKTKSHFAFQEIVLIGGLEQGIALPEAAFLIGYRDFSGLEFGIGPIFHLGGVGVVAALGWTVSYRGVYIPFDVSYIIKNADRPGSFAITTGFNFQVSRSEPKEPEKSQKPQESQSSPESQGSP